MRIVALLACLLACGRDPVTPPPVPPAPISASYWLTELVYIDVYPGQYAAHLESVAGSASMVFAERDGRLVVPDVVTGVLAIDYPDSTSEKRGLLVLPKGNFGFTFVKDAAGFLQFTDGPALFPIVSGAQLTDSLYSFDHTQCFDATEPCTNYVRLAFRWVKQ